MSGFTLQEGTPELRGDISHWWAADSAQGSTAESWEAGSEYEGKGGKAICPQAGTFCHTVQTNLSSCGSDPSRAANLQDREEEKAEGAANLQDHEEEKAEGKNKLLQVNSGRDLGLPSMAVWALGPWPSYFLWDRGISTQLPVPPLDS